MGKPTTDPQERYKRWHWGIDAEKTKILSDEPLPKNMQLIGIGNLRELHVDPLDGGEQLRLGFDDEDSWAAFDMDHPVERIYLIVPERVRKEVVSKIIDKKGEWWDLDELAQAVGGKQAGYEHQNVEVQPIGVLTHIVYLTEKRGDGRSEYIHEFGEVSGKQPVLAASKDGRLWVAAGDYTSPYAGITN
tara:strand:- start:453 stop:1019 length:567 start_codon:yes stop_codon:yes gene_type:complete